MVINKRISSVGLARRIPYLRIISAAILVNAVTIIFLYLILHRLPPVVPLYYGLPAGEEQLARSEFIMIPPVIVILVTLINSTLILGLRDKFLQQVLVGLSVCATLLALIAVFEIVLLVGNF